MAALATLSTGLWPAPRRPCKHAVRTLCGCPLICNRDEMQHLICTASWQLSAQAQAWSHRKTSSKRQNLRAQTCTPTDTNTLTSYRSQLLRLLHTEAQSAAAERNWPPGLCHRSCRARSTLDCPLSCQTCIKDSTMMIITQERNPGEKKIKGSGHHAESEREASRDHHSLSLNKG